ncbi:MAG: tyrosine-type recombinase/integrase [Thermacetogeniaceae bacterium]|jgi:integrase
MAKKRRNANGEGTIYQIKKGKYKGRWVAQITIGRTEDGKLKRKSFYGKSRGEVKEKLDAYKEQMNLGIDQEAVKNTTFGDWLATWLDLYKRPKLRTSTLENYVMYAENHILPAMGHIYLSELNSDDIQALYNNLQKDGKAPATISKIHQIIHSCLQKAVEKRMLVWNPAKATERPTVRQIEAKALTEEDMNKFLAALENESHKWRAAFLTLLGTGLRIGELLALEWDDIDFDKGLLYVRRGLSRTKAGLVVEEPKTEKSKAPVPIPDTVLQALKEHRKAQKVVIMENRDKYKKEYESRVFPTDVGTYMSPRNFQRKYYSIRKKAGIDPEVNLHGLRHTFATRLLEQGESLRVVQELLRHSDIKTTANIYSHVTPKVKDKAAHKMDNLLKKVVN